VERPKNRTDDNYDEMILNAEEGNNDNEDMNMNNEEMQVNSEEMQMNSEEMQMNSEEMQMNNEEMQMNREEIQMNNEEMHMDNDEDSAVNYEANTENSEIPNVLIESALNLGVSFSCGSEVLADSSTTNSCSERSDAATGTQGYTGRINSSNKVIVPGMLSLVATERKCCICGGKGRNRVPLTAVIDTWMNKQVFIPPSNRCCKMHLENGKLKKEIVLSPQKKDSEISGTQLSKLMHGIASYFAKNRRTLDFDGVNYDDQVYGMLLGVSKQNFEELYKVTCKDMRNSRNR